MLPDFSFRRFQLHYCCEMTNRSPLEPPDSMGGAYPAIVRARTAILIMWGRPLACRLRCLWLRKGVENFVRRQISVFFLLCSK